MNKNFLYIILGSILVISPSFAYSQSLPDINKLDQDYLQSLPKSIQDDILKEMNDQQQKLDKNLQKRPSSKLLNSEIVKEWEEFKAKRDIEQKTERYGLKLFRTMQSSFMPLNEPNFGSDYVVDYGDILRIYKYGGGSSETFEVEIGRDGSVILPDIGNVPLAGLNFEQVSELIQKTYDSTFIGSNVFVSLSEIRDINVLVTGNVEFPGIYTLSGNSNVLQALNIVGGITENGSLRKVVLKRKGSEDKVIDLYKAIIFGEIDSIPSLMSGDSLYVESVTNLVRAGYGFNNIAVYELKDDEKLSDLIKFAGGLKAEVASNSLKLVRFNNPEFVSYEVNQNEINDYELQNLDSIYAFKEKIGTVKVSGYVKYPGNYSISSSDRMLDILQRSGGYIDSAYPFGGTLLRKNTKDLETNFAEKTYQNLISYIAANPSNMGNGSGEGLAYVLSELKNYKPTGRFIAEFDTTKLSEDIQNNVYLNDGDEIFIPSYTSNVFIFGEVGNPGSVLYKDDLTINEYINKSGGLTRLASSNYIFIVSPNGETLRVETNGIRRFITQTYDIYPGSVIYVPRHIGKVDGINLYATLAPIFSSLALSIASLNSIND